MSSDNSEVESDYGNPKSISTSEVLPYNYTNLNDIYRELKRLSMDTGKRLREKKMYSPNVNIWVKFHDFSKISKQVTLDNLINSDEDGLKFDSIFNYTQSTVNGNYANCQTAVLLYN